MKEQTLMLSGKIDTKNSSELQEKIDAVLADGVTDLTLDMKDVDFLASMGIRVLLGTFKKLKSLGGSLRVVNPSAFVLNTLSMVGMDTQLVDMSTVQAADESTSDTDYTEPYSLTRMIVLDGDPEQAYAFADDFANKIGLHKDILNGMKLIAAEFEEISKFNKKENFHKEAEMTYAYTPSPKQMTFSAVSKDHDISRFAKNLHRINEKSFDVDDAQYDLIAEMGKRSFIQFWDSFEPKQEGADIVVAAVKKLR